MTEAPSPQREEISSYHHFVPQFILKNFGYKYKPTSTFDMKEKVKQHIYRGNMLVEGICLTDSNVALVSAKITRTSGVQDLYAYERNSTDKEYIEKLLGKLECRASEIIARVRSNHESGKKKRSPCVELRKMYCASSYSS